MSPLNVQTKTTGTIDYAYDENGNMTKDLNKDIGKAATTGIFYNHLNLPRLINLYTTGGVLKGSITYTYDAGGNKLKKVTLENGNASNNNITTTTTTLYLGGFVYETKTDNNAQTTDYTDRLQFMGHEEGRIRAVYDNAGSPNTPTGLEYDYMIKDHLGNLPAGRQV